MYQLGCTIVSAQMAGVEHVNHPLQNITTERTPQKCTCYTQILVTLSLSRYHLEVGVAGVASGVSHGCIFCVTGWLPGQVQQLRR